MTASEHTHDREDYEKALRMLSTMASGYHDAEGQPPAWIDASLHAITEHLQEGDYER
jgi:hypothetical protein